MKQGQINKAYAALTRLAECRLPISKARAIYVLLKEAEEFYKFAMQEESKYIKEYNGKITSNGSISFDKPEDSRRFQEKLIELNNSEVEWDVSLITLEDIDMGDNVISPSDIYYLEGIVSFK